MTSILTVSPVRPSLDTELRIGLSGLPPGGEVTLRATQHDPRGGAWCSASTFQVTGDGTVDLHRDAPVRGGYSAVDPMGPVWSMTPLVAANGGGPVDVTAPTVLRLVAEVGGAEVADAEVPRLRVPDGLCRAEVREGGLVGVLYRPDDDRVRPGVLVLGGSEGGLHEDDAALLAGHGYAALALAYYGLPGLPETLREIPLEYFGAALDLLAAHPAVDAGRLGVTGGSKGGEAALLIGATFDRVRAVVSVVGSGLVTQGIAGDIVTGSLLDILGTPVPNWTWRGRALPYLPNVVTDELRAAVAAGEPVTLRSAAPALLRDNMTEAATIPVERIRGGVLLISTGDDQGGYGADFHEVAAARLAAHGHPRFRHVVHEGAGHGICAPPYGPTTRSLWPGPGVTFRNGGTPAADARAREAAWRDSLRFLAGELA
jgi:dienelactone hydrolase